MAVYESPFPLSFFWSIFFVPPYQRQVDKVSYLMNKSTESYATRTVKALSEASKVDAPKGTEEDDVLEAALTVTPLGTIPIY